MNEVKTITVSLALAELKLLEKKIEKKTDELIVAGKCMASNKTAAESEMLIHKANLQALQGLMKRRINIKKALLKSNAETTVTVGDKVFTIAEAIERKKSIAFEKRLESHMRNTYYVTKNDVEVHNGRVNAAATASVEKILSSQNIKATETEITSEGSAYKTFYDKYVENNGVAFVQIPEIEKTIDTMREEIDQFEMLIDNALSVSNATTSITIE